ncbi:uncharacterized protein LOC141684905 [Apium graveolens]|uniref:uncharacterized protein LOC141684905 n=1 Tax=Apium graveolens TaxID=4045 RepID=UPI003D7A9194
MLLKAGLVRESHYPKWLANPVLVKKPNGKWRTCVDFTDLNKACPKDSFPLSQIDQLVDATARPALLSFMDKYSGYNQIPMFKPNKEHTSFIIDMGLYCYIGMPFGLLNAGATYQRLVNRMFKNQIAKMMEVFVDDMLLKSRVAADHKLKQQLGSPPLLFKPMEGEVLILYLAVSEYSISIVLVHEKGKVQSPVYYVNKRLQDAETRYTNMEKLAYALILAARKLRPYFQAHKVELGQFDVDYKPRTAIKGQALADFLLEFPETFSVEGNECVTELKMKVQKKENFSPWWTLYVDGAVNGKGAGAVIHLEQIPRTENSDADALAKLGSQKEATLLGVIPLKVKQQPSIPKMESATIEESNVNISWEKFMRKSAGTIQEEPLWLTRYYAKEAEPLDAITAIKLKEFVLRAIVCRYGVPYKLIFDNEKQFDINEMKKLFEDLHIKKGFSEVCHPQSNGQTEAINKIINHTLKAKLEENKGCWPEELPKVLWSYNITPRTITCEYPFTLTYGCEAMVHVEIGAGSFRRENYDPDNNELNHHFYLDLLEEVRENSQLKLAAYQQWTRKYFDKKVRARPLRVKDLVLRRMMPNMKTPGHGVFGANWEGSYIIKTVLWERTYHLTDLDGKLIPRAWNSEHLKRYYQ